MSDQGLAPYHVAYWGNFEPEFSTENDYVRAWGNNGHVVTRFQEGDAHQHALLLDGIRRHEFDLIIWTRTESLANLLGDAAQWKLLAEARRHAVPVIGVHLDRWWGLGREKMIQDAPFFRVDVLFTADGGHDEYWKLADVHHRWLLPGVSERWCKPGTFRAGFASEIAFVGGWQGTYHKEAEHRFALVNWLDETYAKRVKFWPERGQPAIRGESLTDLYWSTKVVVGDSCLVPKPDGSPMTHYCSDRIPETLGRGGPLVHPWVEGINWERLRPGDDPFYGIGHNWKMWDWDDLRDLIDSELEDPDMDRDWRLHMIASVKAKHTYERRVPEIISVLKEEGLIP